MDRKLEQRWKVKFCVQLGQSSPVTRVQPTGTTLRWSSSRHAGRALFLLDRRRHDRIMAKSRAYSLIYCLHLQYCASWIRLPEPDCLWRVLLQGFEAFESVGCSTKAQKIRFFTTMHCDTGFSSHVCSSPKTTFYCSRTSLIHMIYPLRISISPPKWTYSPKVANRSRSSTRLEKTTSRPDSKNGKNVGIGASLRKIALKSMWFYYKT